MLLTLKQEYINNIQVVDDIVRETEQLFSGFYGDQETSYIFTADHGMSKIGNHGDGGNSPSFSEAFRAHVLLSRPRQHSNPTYCLGCWHS